MPHVYPRLEWKWNCCGIALKRQETAMVLGVERPQWKRMKRNDFECFGMEACLFNLAILNERTVYWIAAMMCWVAPLMTNPGPINDSEFNGNRPSIKCFAMSTAPAKRHWSKIIGETSFYNVHGVTCYSHSLKGSNVLSNALLHILSRFLVGKQPCYKVILVDPRARFLRKLRLYPPMVGVFKVATGIQFYRCKVYPLHGELYMRELYSVICSHIIIYIYTVAQKIWPPVCRGPRGPHSLETFVAKGVQLHARDTN